MGVYVEVKLVASLRCIKDLRNHVTRSQYSRWDDRLLKFLFSWRMKKTSIFTMCRRRHIMHKASPACTIYYIVHFATHQEEPPKSSRFVDQSTFHSHGTNQTQCFFSFASAAAGFSCGHLSSLISRFRSFFYVPSFPNPFCYLVFPERSVQLTQSNSKSPHYIVDHQYN